MSRALAALSILLTLAACSPKAEPTAPAALNLDCKKPFEAQAAAIRGQPNLAPPSHEPGEPYTFYSTVDGRVSFVVTDTGAPGHPALIRQEAVAGGMRTTGCAYGNKRGYEQLLTYVQTLKRGAKR